MNQNGPVSTRAMELATASLLMLFGALVMWNSWRIGASWVDGPQSGYFPFRVGLLIFVSSAGIFAMALASKAGAPFVGRAQFRMVLEVFVPTMVFCALIAVLGIYAASAIFIAYFMIRMDNYPMLTTAAVSLGVPIFLFLLFEVWFVVPLPKGPIEALLGY